MSAPAPSLAPPPSVASLAAAFGVDADGAEVVRAATRHVVRFPVAGVRTFAVAGGTTGPRQEVAVAALLADAGVPAARCLAGPAEVEGWTVTAWREVPGVDPDAPPAPADVVGALAARLHQRTGVLDPRGLVACDPIGAGLAQLEVALRHERTSEDDLLVLRRAATRLEAVWQAAVEAALADPALGAVLHGDLHAGNVVVGRDGPVLVDLELAGWGPRAYDAAPTVAFVRWYDRPDGDAVAFDEAYGASLTHAAATAGLDEVWALWSTCWSVANRHRSPAAEEEARVRIATVATGEAPRPWLLR